MAYRRRQQVGKLSTFRDESSESHYGDNSAVPPPETSWSSSSASSLAAKAIRASSAHRDSSLSSAYGESALSPHRDSKPPRSSSPPSASKESFAYEYTPMQNLEERKQGFWGTLARKAKAILDDDVPQSHEAQGGTRMHMSDRETRSQNPDTSYSSNNHVKKDGPAFQKGLGAIASSLNYIGGTIGNAFEEGLSAVENRTADIIQETRKIQIRRKNSSSASQNQFSNVGDTRRQPTIQNQMSPQMETDFDIQLKASRDVAMAMAAKAKLLLRELKTVKADLAFAKERCAQLEEENKILRESNEKGSNLEDDDLIRLQLETLLAEKARLAQENSVYARENRFLREIVEYHQLTMQDVVYLDENNEEVTEVYPLKVATVSNTQPISTLPSLTSTPPVPTVPPGANLQGSLDVSSGTKASSKPADITQTATPLSPYIQMP